MITIISGTNRKNSNTHKIAKEYQCILQEKGIGAGLFSLEALDLVHYNDAFRKIEEEVIIPTTHFIIVSPEYNGSFPGILKMLFDTSRSHEIWHHKKALLTGVASGRAGNLRGMDHLADVLNFLKITVHPNKLPISMINKIISPEGNIVDEGTIRAINQQIDEFINWASLQTKTINPKHQTSNPKL